MTSVPPSEYLDDPVMFAALRDEAEDAEWTTTHELLAMNVEVTHTLLRQMQISAGAKEHDVSKPLRIPRPHDEKPRRVGAVEAALAIGGKRGD